MKKYIIGCILLLLILSCSLNSKKPQPVMEDTDYTTLVSGNNQFAIKMYKELCQFNPNVLFSPYSISTAFGMVNAGAVGTTQQEIISTMSFPQVSNKLPAQFKSLATAINTSPQKSDYQLQIANALFASSDLQNRYRKDYLSLMQEYYSAALSFLDFSNQTEAASAINKWVAEKTNHTIDQIISEDLIDPSIALILTNAIYFKGEWERRFNAANTKDMEFHTPTEKGEIAYAKIPMMNDLSSYRYADLDQFQVIELPYKGKDLSMLVLLPKKINGIDELEKNMNMDNLNTWISKLSPQEVNVTIPKFKMMLSYDKMEDNLKNMGMKAPFDNADFSGIIKDEPIHISKVIHKAFIIVNEEGTEASAATAVVMRKTLSAPEVMYRADHPFIYMIIHQKTNSILFMGKMQDPGKL